MAHFLACRKHWMECIFTTNRIIVKQMLSIREEGKKKLETSNTEYKVAAGKTHASINDKKGALVMAYLRTKRFLVGTYNKIKYDPSKIPKK